MPPSDGSPSGRPGSQAPRSTPSNIGPGTAAELLIVTGDNISRIRSEAAWAGLCGVAPIPASSGITAGHRLNRGGHRQANAALYRTVIVRMQHHEPTRAYVARRIAEGKTEAEIICCLKRHLAAKPGHSSARFARPPRHPRRPVDSYRSIIAAGPVTVE